MSLDAHPIQFAASPLPGRIVRLQEVRKLTGLSRSGLYRRMKEDAFPRAIGLGGRSVGWLEAEIAAWINQRVEERGTTGEHKSA
jgi:prophage regulatory protein